MKHNGFPRDTNIFNGAQECLIIVDWHRQTSPKIIFPKSPEIVQHHAQWLWMLDKPPETKSIWDDALIEKINETYEAQKAWLEMRKKKLIENYEKSEASRRYKELKTTLQERQYEWSRMVAQLA